MDLGMLFIVIPIFLIAYQGVGIFLDSRTHKQWGPLSEVPREPSTQKAQREFVKLSAMFGFNKTLLRVLRLNERLDLLLLRSGNPFGWKETDLLFFKEITGVLLTLLVWCINGPAPVALIIGFVLGFWLPDIYLLAKITERQSAIQQSLPGLIDLISLALESGLDFMTGIERILEKMKPGSLREELSQVLQEDRLGTPRKESLQHLAHRVDLSDVQSFTSLVIQSEELGTGLAGVLRSYSEDMRNKRILRAEEAGAKAPVKLLFPMIVFFFPIVFVIIFGPLALNFMSSYK